MIVLTGGSTVFNRTWHACDKPLRNHGRRSQLQFTIDSKVGQYLVSHGLVNRTFSYITFKVHDQEILILQSRNYYKAPVSDEKLISSIMAWFSDHHHGAIVVKSPYSDIGNAVERLKKIRQVIAIYPNLISTLASPYGDGIAPLTSEYPFITQPSVFSRLSFIL